MKVQISWILVLLAVSCTPQATPGADTPVTSPPEEGMVYKGPSSKSLLANTGR